ncbi:MAG TPA: tRNA 2-thiouridine(34) synthase MnmA [Candidatus Paceibacterota bacterium]|jgi:tRNA-specific 2-thiouridylase|nr:tRNA 2-thiouridine(34) synthase MnmA [Candidatus Paceibacterota bacterium]
MSEQIKGKKVFVGLSGGVDSATSAALLLQDGYDVTGVFIRIVVEGYPCTAGEDRLDAMRVAAHLKIPFVEIDLSKEYQDRVFVESIKEFKRGLTPNPDVLCNREIKFGLFYEWARANGADLVATGHYAQSKDGEFKVSADKEKDQSYFLWAVPQDVLKHVLFPIGHLQKPEVRKLAAKFGLLNAQRKDSQGLCFLGPISVGDMLKRELNPTPGDLLNEAGEVVGSHDGAVLYTLGQRQGFVLNAHTPDSVPHYVIAKDILKNTVTVSSNKFPKDASKTEVTLADINWIGQVQNGSVSARYRYRQTLIPAELDAANNKVTLLEPHYAPEGQSLVLYKQDRCLGGGAIKEVRVY